MAYSTADTLQPSTEMSSMFDNDRDIPDEVKSLGRGGCTDLLSTGGRGRCAGFISFYCHQGCA